MHAHDQVDAIRKEARLAVDPHDKRNDSDYIFITSSWTIFRTE